MIVTEFRLLLHSVSMDLYCQSYPDDFLQRPADERLDDPTPVLIIPGLFGSTANWRSIAKSLSADCPVIVIDQRNHGRSPHAESNSYTDLVADLLGFLNRNELDKIILCGHSMGGKVAMLFALLHPDRVEKLAVLDIAPVVYQHSHAPFLEELLKVDLATLESRRDADQALASVIPDIGTRLFLLQSLAGTAGRFFWRINLSVLYRFMPQLVGFPEKIVAGIENDCDAIFLSGGLSDYVKPGDHQNIHKYFRNARFAEVPQAGHWLHAEQPEKVLNAMQEFIEI